ncbi:hypothetical protein HNY73_019362 [Argiope bruennichi]|uniref:Uncharacterized protein n=1 Tax=Argiope bruennichi TaxID=94029 RepID=A0A8T0EGE1_ARGBR|nr:hypothetical protein HNY73_019362 [Argiope bruennichi]
MRWSCNITHRKVRRKKFRFFFQEFQELSCIRRSGSAVRDTRLSFVLATATREDLITLATELGETLGSKETKITLKDVILKSVDYEEKYVKELLLAIAEERKARVEEEKVRARAETEERERSKRLELEFEERKRKDEMEFVLQKLRFHHNTSLSQTEYRVRFRAIGFKTQMRSTNPDPSIRS